MTSYQALVMHDLINSATVNQRAANVFNLWAIPYTNPTPPPKQNQIQISYECFHKAKDFKLLTRDNVVI